MATRIGAPDNTASQPANTPATPVISIVGGTVPKSPERRTAAKR